jgi:uncharacterized membrane protein YhiD involved in acid resistance
LQLQTAIGAVILAVILLFIIAKLKKEARIRKYQRQENERFEARQRSEQRENQKNARLRSKTESKLHRVMKVLQSRKVQCRYCARVNKAR